MSLSWPAAPYCAAIQAPKLRGAVLLSLSLKRRRVAIFPERIASSNAGDTAGRLLPTACKGAYAGHISKAVPDGMACMCFLRWKGPWGDASCALPLPV